MKTHFRFFVLIIFSILALNPAAGEETLEDKIGIVAASILQADISDPSGPAMAETVARGWDTALLAEGFQVPGSISAKFQTKENGTYDAVAFNFSVNSVSLLTRQTIAVWALTISGQDTAGKTDQELSALLKNLAETYLRSFLNRQFVSQGAFEGKKVFSISIDAGHETGDWKDYVFAVVDSDKVSFVTLKKLAEAQLMVVSNNPELNESWFSVLSTGDKRKVP